jgi:hypothetical protein
MYLFINYNENYQLLKQTIKEQMAEEIVNR